MIAVSAAVQSAVLLSMTLNIASEMHFNASRSLTQPCLTACCICCNYRNIGKYVYFYNPGILLISANYFILGNVNLRSNLSWIPAVHQHSCTGAADFETRCGGARTRALVRVQ